MTPARWMTVLSYAGMLAALAVPAALYLMLGEGPGAAIPALSALGVGVFFTLIVAALALAFTVVELREARPRHTPAHIVWTGASALVVLLSLVATIRVWPF